MTKVWPETKSMSSESQEPCEANKEYQPQDSLSLQYGWPFPRSLVCTSSRSCEWWGHPTEAMSPKPQYCYTLFPAKQFLHDMGQRVIGTLPSRPPWTSHGRSYSGKIHDLEQIMIMMIIILAIMEDRTYKTLKILRCWWFILWESGIDSEDSASGPLAMNSKTCFNNLKYMSPIKRYEDYSKWNNNNIDDDDVDGSYYNLKVNCLK